MSAEPNGSKELFTDFYYKTFDENRQSLAALYVRASLASRCLPSRSITDHGPDTQRDNSMLTFEASAVLGVAAITEKLTVSVQ